MSRPQLFSLLLSFRWKMSNIWFPVPVATLFRRLVNAISTASIAHHYLLPSRSFALSDPHPEHELDPRSTSRVLRGNGREDLGSAHAPPTAIGADDLGGLLKGPSVRQSPSTSTIVLIPSYHSIRKTIHTLASLAHAPLALPPCVQVRTAACRAPKNGRGRVQFGSYSQLGPRPQSQSQSLPATISYRRRA